jgi:tetratricopeptide (TPR) repeat protein
MPKLAEALQHHQAGRLETAVQLYQDILDATPEHADALHLLGVVSFQQKHLDRAAELIGRAIALRPDVAACYANLGEVYRARGQLDRAMGCYRTALQLQPHNPEATNNLGLALLAQGDVEAAIARFEEALGAQPDHALLHNNLGNAWRVRGDGEQALTHFRRAVQLAPELAEAHSNLGQLLLERYDVKNALRHCKKAVALRAEFPEAHNNLGNALREAGRFEQACASYAEALRLAPALALTYNNMAQALQAEGRLREAISWYHQALEREPNSARIHTNLGSALEEREEYALALAHYRTALQFEPNYAEAHNGLGVVLHEQGNYPEALAAFRQVVQLKPGFAQGHCSLGNILEELGDLDEALQCFRETLRHDPDHAGARALLATLLRGKLPEEDLTAMRTLLDRKHLAPGRRMALHFGVAHVLDGRKSYREAAAHLQHGNSLASEIWNRQGMTYDPQAHTRFVDRLIDMFTPEFFAHVRGFGLESERPVFIVGLPRSGTTLTEQVLASHSQVHGAGELNFMRDTFEALPRVLNLKAGPLDALTKLQRQAAHHLADRHLERLADLDAHSPRIVDKMPENYIYLGLMAVLFPKARFIHCRRDLRDVAVSCWMTNFRHVRWSADLEHIAGRLRDYRRLMDHWQRVLPVPVLEVDYEATVDDLEGVARRLVDWCELEWEPACLAFHETNRPVRTASVTQVRQPIYKRSVARWKNYEPELTPLFEQLEPYCT